MFQHSLVDRKRKLFVTVTENLNQRTSMCVTERCTYSSATNYNREHLIDSENKNSSQTKSLSSINPKSWLFSRRTTESESDSLENLSSNVKSRLSNVSSESLKNFTIVNREVWVTSKRPAIRTALEAFGKQKYKLNVKKTLAGLVEVLTRLQKEAKLYSLMSNLR